MKQESVIRIVFSCILVFIIVILIATAVLPHDRAGWWGGSYRVIRDVTVKRPGRAAESTLLPITENGEETITVSYKLPENLDRGSVMAINSAWEKITLSWNGKTETFDWGRAEKRAVRWTVLKLSVKDAGSTVRAVIVPGRSLSGGYMNQVIAGEQTALYYYLFRESLPDIAAGLCGLICGMLIMMFSVRMIRNRKTLQYRYLATGLIIAGILMICENRFGRAIRITGSFAAAFDAPGICLMVASYLMYVREILDGSFARVFTAVAGGYAAVTFLNMISRMTGAFGLIISCHTEMTLVILIPVLVFPSVLIARRLRSAAGQSVIWRDDRGSVIRTGRNLPMETAEDLRTALWGSVMCVLALLIDLSTYLATGVQDYMGGECIALLFLSIVAALRFVRYMIGEVMESEEVSRRYEESGRFLENMSGAIGEPVGEILAHNQNVYMASADSTIKNYTRQIQSACNVLLSVIGNIRSFSELESGQAEPHPELYDLPELIGECASLVEVMAENKGLQLKASCDPGLPVTLIGDREWIRMILTNLLTNAVKYTTVGSVTLEAESNGIDEDGKIPIRFTVEDTGIGISREEQERIFETFHRLSDAKRPGLEGAGLGLSLTRRLIELQDGALWLDSAPGKGSRFEVFLAQETLPGTERVGERGVWHPANAQEEDDGVLHALSAFLNTEEGLGYCMDDPKLYLEMILDYIHSDRCALLEKAYAAGNWKSYRVSVHALKSTSRMIGADEIFPMALELENASADGDTETICAGHGILMKKTEALQANLAAVLSENATEVEMEHENSDL